MEKSEEIEKLLELIQKQQDPQPLIIVEGKNDKIALQNLSFEHIITLEKKPLYKVVDAVIKINSRTLILTDLDKEGKQLYGKLNHQLQQHGIKVDNQLRNFLFKNTQLRQIEGLSSYIARKQIKSN